MSVATRVQAQERLAQHPEPAPALDAVQYLWSLGFDTAEIAQMLRVHQSVICRMDYRGVRS